MLRQPDRSDDARMLKLPLVGAVAIRRKSPADTPPTEGLEQQQQRQQPSDGATGNLFSLDWLTVEELATCDEFLNDSMWEFETDLTAQ